MRADFLLMALHRDHDERAENEKKEAFYSDGAFLHARVAANLAFSRFGLIHARFFGFFDEGLGVLDLRAPNLNANLDTADAWVDRADMLFRNEGFDSGAFQSCFQNLRLGQPVEIGDRDPIFDVVHVRHGNLIRAFSKKNARLEPGID